ncbi:hypothetical protein ACGF07_03910 [Kitasatospora sp. NPDC048194]|uniref:hypothetical protein n=1 Tax=Kitasatospora sp. NPDC048194 TaxID=3364045 RepID=UPI00371666C9
MASAGDEVAEPWGAAPAKAVALARRPRSWTLRSTSAITAGLLAPNDAGEASDSSVVAEQCLGADPHFALAVALAPAPSREREAATDGP